MTTEVEWGLYTLLSWPDYKAGRQISKEYKQKYKRGISYGALYLTLRRLVESGFAEFYDDSDQDGRLRYFRRSSGRKRPEKPLEKGKTLENRIVPELT